MHDAIHSVSPDHILVDRLVQMRDGFCAADPAEMLARQVALGEMTQAHADRLAQMLADRDSAEPLAECDWCGVEVGMNHHCPFLADLPDCAKGTCDC